MGQRAGEKGACGKHKHKRVAGLVPADEKTGWRHERAARAAGWAAVRRWQGTRTKQGMAKLMGYRGEGVRFVPRNQGGRVRRVW